VSLRCACAIYIYIYIYIYTARYLEAPDARKLISGVEAHNEWFKAVGGSRHFDIPLASTVKRGSEARLQTTSPVLTFRRACRRRGARLTRSSDRLDGVISVAATHVVDVCFEFE